MVNHKWHVHITLIMGINWMTLPTTPVMLGTCFGVGHVLPCQPAVPQHRGMQSTNIVKDTGNIVEKIFNSFLPKWIVLRFNFVIVKD